jgi:hypothetical protein
MGTRGPPKKQVEDPPGPHACGRICELGLEWRGVKLMAACGPFHTGTAGSRGTLLPRLCHRATIQVPLPPAG